MMANVCAEYSGVVIDQNVVTGSLTPNNSFYYQEFRLPEDYLRGVKIGQTRFPGISGFQLLAAVEEDAATTCTLNYTIEQHNFGNSAWEVLAKGTVTGAQAEGERIWIDAILDQEIEVTASMTTNVSELRIGFQIVSGIEKLYYAQPNPLPGFVEALQSDGKALLTPSASFAFRLLALTADSGTDFLGDPYRSVAIHSSAQAPVGENTNSGYWLSAPQPSKFAVTSHYSDLRTFPSTPRYGVINTLLNPSFEYDVVGGQPFGWFINPPLEELQPELVGSPKVIDWIQPLQAQLSSSGFIPTLEEESLLEELSPKAPEPAKALFTIQPLDALLRFDTYESKATLKVIEAIEAPRGDNVLEVKTIAHTKEHFYEPEGTYAQIAVWLGKPITFSVWVRSNVGKYFLVLEVGDSTVGKSEQVVEVDAEWQRFSVTLTPIENGTTTVAVRTLANETTARIFYIDGAMTNKGIKAAPYIDGDSPSCKWENQRGRSASIELVEPELEDNAVVIDSIILDPITPGVAFNIYYTNDLTGTTEGEMTEEEWEQKLWVHVPQSYVTSVKTTYVLPEPITAKFIKIEFSQLQARPYEPGDYQKPTTYKLFPDWAATPFLAEVALPAFTAKRVGVVYDALELGYKPLLDDLIQGPSSPEHPTPTPSIAPPASNRVDPETLRMIETTLNTYTKPPAARGDPLTLLGARAATSANNAPSYPVEGEPQFRGNPSMAVSGLNRQAIVFDESMPVMYFWVTCRHEYKELNALFENDRAYFAGLKELAFLRSQFSVTAYTELYIEAGTDDTNTELSDFNVETFPVELDGVVYGEESVWFPY